MQAYPLKDKNKAFISNEHFTLELEDLLNIQTQTKKTTKAIIMKVDYIVSVIKIVFQKTIIQLRWEKTGKGGR